MTEDHLCAAGERCLGFDRREDRAELLDGHPVLGEACLSASERAVPLLVRDYADLEQHLPLSSSRGDGQPSGSGELRVPLNLSVEALQRKIHAVLTVWEEVARDFARLYDAPRLARPGAAVQRAAEVLAPRVRLLASIPSVTVLDYPDVDETETFRLGGIRYAEVPGWRGVMDLARLHRQAVAAQGLTDARPELCSGVPCKNPDCDLQALYRDPGEDTVHCGACGWRYTAEEYRDWTRLVSASVKQEA